MNKEAWRWTGGAAWTDSLLDNAVLLEGRREALGVRLIDPIEQERRKIKRPSRSMEEGRAKRAASSSAFYPRRSLSGKQAAFDILARGSVYRPRLLSLMANGMLRLSSSLTATGSRRLFTGLPEGLLLVYVISKLRRAILEVNWRFLSHKPRRTRNRQNRPVS
jgi:hypothetical protein